MREWLGGVRLWFVTPVRAAPVLMCCTVVFGMILGLLAPLQAFAMKLVVDALTSHDDRGLADATAMVISLFALTYVMNCGNAPLLRTVVERVRSCLHADLIRVVGGIPGIAHHEQPGLADRIELLRRDAHRMSFNIMQLLSLVVTGVNIVAITALLVSVDPVLVGLLGVGALRIGAGHLDGRLRWKATRTSATDTRLVRSLLRLGSAASHGVEVRTFHLQPMLLQRVDQALARVEAITVRAACRGATYEFLARICFGLSYAGAIVLVAVAVRRGTIGPGGIALVVLLGSRIEHAAADIAIATRQTGETIRMFQQYAWLRCYATAHSWANATGPAPDRLEHGIRLKNVHFAYPGTARPVLDGIDLHLPAGSTVALVGENGAGKSTLVKLLARLYEPAEGRIEVDGLDLCGLDAPDWRRHVSSGFQDFVRFEFQARDSVGVGDLRRRHERGAVLEALRRADADGMVEQLEEGLKAQLGKRFAGGVELSGGQWQRVALARAFMRRQPLLLLLDEPTAALDPDSEHALFAGVASVSRAFSESSGAITVLVSHRFSTARAADLIVVLHEGRVVETGSHRDLMSAGGRYAELFGLQARAYR